MKNFKVIIPALTILCVSLSCGTPSKDSGKPEKSEHAIKSEQPVAKTSDESIRELMNGNQRFVDNKLINTDYQQQVDRTKTGQKPFAVILSCMDSRVPPEIIFDQGIGNIFVIRVAGNVEDENVLGSMEYAVEHSGSKLIVVMGHSHCGAVTGAVEDVRLGHLTQLLDQIKPAIKGETKNQDIIDVTAKNNVLMSISDILKRSEIISRFVEEKKVAIVGAFYEIETGVVTFMQ